MLVGMSDGLGTSVRVFANVAVAVSGAAVELLSRRASGAGWQAARTTRQKRIAFNRRRRNIFPQEMILPSQLFLCHFPPA
jgi:hypothetical protein